MLDEDGQVPLGFNPRGRWELPGVWPEPGDVSVEGAARRGVPEEYGFHISIGPLVTACLNRDTDAPGAVVLVVVGAHAVLGAVPVADGEHPLTGFLPTGALPDALASSYREASALATAESPDR